MASYAGGYVALGVVGILTICAAYRAWKDRDDRVVLLLLLTLTPVIGGLAYGMCITRYGIAAVIGIVLLSARGASSINRTACIIVVALAAANWAITSSLGHPRYPDYTPK